MNNKIATYCYRSAFIGNRLKPMQHKTAASFPPSASFCNR